MLARRFWPLALLVGALLLMLPGPAQAAVQHCGDPGEQPCKADLSVALSPPTGAVYVGEMVPVNMTVSNTGPAFVPPLTSVSVPGTVSSQGSTHTDGECVVSCAPLVRGLFTPGSQTVVLHIRPEVAGRVTISASVAVRPTTSFTRVDPNTANNTATLTLNAVIGRCTSQILAPVDLPADIIGSIGGDVINGDGFADDLHGAGGDDCIDGGAWNDLVAGGPGADLLKGGSGDDRIIGGPGRDQIQGNGGDDLINTVDGWRDVVSCGFGYDRLRADRYDRFHGCEHVTIVR